MIMNHLLLLIAVLSPAGVVQAAAPSIHVGAMYEYLEPGRGTLLKRVRNTGDATAFVRVQVSEVRYGDDGGPAEHAMDTSVDGAAAGAPGLVASPSRLIVPAQGQQATRLLYQGDRSEERYYRVRFVPALPQSLDEFALSEEESEAYRAVLTAGVNVLTGYGVFVIVHPEAPRYDTRTTPSAEGHVLRNMGNATVVLEGLRQCRGTGKAACTPERKEHLLPGRALTLPRHTEDTHHYELVEGDRRTAVQLTP
jgi:hypothetical protein